MVSGSNPGFSVSFFYFIIIFRFYFISSIYNYYTYFFLLANFMISPLLASGSGYECLSVPGRPIIWIIVGQGRTVLAVDAGGGCSDIFSRAYHFSFLLLLSGMDGSMT